MQTQQLLNDGIATTAGTRLNTMSQKISPRERSGGRTFAPAGSGFELVHWTHVRSLADSLRAVLSTAGAGVLLAGCAATSTPTVPPMMGGAATATAGNPSVTGSPMMAGAPGMMDAGPGYPYSRLTCSAPTSLPGSTVHVIVGDMGMTSMMGGVAPLGGHMMLRAFPASVPTGQVSFVVGNMGWRTHEMVVLPLAPGQAAGQRTPGTDGKVDEAGSLGEASLLRGRYGRRHQAGQRRVGHPDPASGPVRTGVQPA